MHCQIIEKGSSEKMQPNPGCINMCLFRLSYLLIEDVKFPPKLLVWKLMCQIRTDIVVAASKKNFTTAFEFWNFQVAKISSKNQEFCWRKFIKLSRNWNKLWTLVQQLSWYVGKQTAKFQKNPFNSSVGKALLNIGCFSADFLKFWGQSSNFKRLYLSNHEVFWESEDIDEMATSQIFQQKSARMHLVRMRRRQNN